MVFGPVNVDPQCPGYPVAGFVAPFLTTLINVFVRARF